MIFFGDNYLLFFRPYDATLNLHFWTFTHPSWDGEIDVQELKTASLAQLRDIRAFVSPCFTSSCQCWRAPSDALLHQDFHSKQQVLYTFHTQGFYSQFLLYMFQSVQERDVELRDLELIRIVKASLGGEEYLAYLVMERLALHRDYTFIHKNQEVAHAFLTANPHEHFLGNTYLHVLARHGDIHALRLM
jgi:hypothetical protein